MFLEMFFFFFLFFLTKKKRSRRLFVLVPRGDKVVEFAELFGGSRETV